MSKSIFCKNLAILAIASTLTACSGVARFAVKDFGDTVNKICGDRVPVSPSELFKLNAKSGEGDPQVSSSATRDAIEATYKLLNEVATSANDSGCFALYTPLFCQVACGGKATPSVPAGKVGN